MIEPFILGRLGKLFVRGLFFIFALAATGIVGAHADSPPTVAIRSRVLWAGPPVNWRVTGSSTGPVTKFADRVFFVYVDDALRPMVGQHDLQTGKTVVRPVWPNAKYRVREDGHHALNLAVDADGFIHLVGDMHDQPFDNVDHIADSRLRSAPMLYWRSKTPADISAGMVFHGDDDSCPPGRGWTYCNFFTGPNNTLHLYARVWAKDSRRWKELGWVEPRRQGSRGWLLAAWDGELWKPIGRPVPDPDRLDDVPPLLFWEPSGVSEAHYQGYGGQITFDGKSLHLAAAINTEGYEPPRGLNQSDGMNAIVYARSDDGGMTWMDSTGRVVSAFADRPLRSSDIDTGRGRGPLRIEVDMAVDDGLPVIAYRQVQPDGARLPYWFAVSPGGGFAMPRPLPGGRSNNRVMTDRGGFLLVPGRDAWWAGHYWNADGSTIPVKNPLATVRAGSFDDANRLFYLTRRGNRVGLAVAEVNRPGFEK